MTAVVWVHTQDRRLLAVLPHETDVWFLPGGLPEAGESLAETTVREVAEETGINLRPGELTELTRVRAKAWGRPGLVELVCMTGGAGGDVQPLALGEIFQIGWINTLDRSGCARAVQSVIDYLHEREIID